MAGCLLLPFAQFSANRIVNGSYLPLFAAAGPVWGGAMAGTLLLMFAAAFAPTRWRGRAVLVAAILAFGAVLFATGAVAARLTPPGSAPARVSVGAGAWLVLMGVGIAWFEGAKVTDSRPASVVAAVAAVALLVVAGVVGGLSLQGIAIEYQNTDNFWTLAIRHVGQSAAGVGLGALLGVPFGVLSARAKSVRSVVIPVVSVIQTLPSLALFGMLMLVLTAVALPSIGTVPTLVALTLYSLLPIVRNTFLGIDGVDPAAVDAGQGMGMSRSQLLWRVELPLALPLLIEGLRQALVLTIGIAAVMAIGGAQNLGTIIYFGIGNLANDQVLLGAIPMVVLAVVADQVMRLVERAVVSPGIRGEVAA